LAAIYVKKAGKDSLFAAATDRQGSLMATMHTARGIAISVFHSGN